ncbi:hypothetical protein GUJ93_ZPchr0009g2019 [Zizania palustris]|uniref:Uncharacterized protein n=1 Tax=Zizania palustris TaxID=103762 RepID=A0A8J5RLC5_ZIZPA|nr:hypothetical protein GUJ93_ZPchr0009g2019 [Zizania palustris]
MVDILIGGKQGNKHKKGTIGLTHRSSSCCCSPPPRPSHRSLRPPRRPYLDPAWPTPPPSPPPARRLPRTASPPHWRHHITVVPLRYQADLPGVVTVVPLQHQYGLPRSLSVAADAGSAHALPSHLPAAHIAATGDRADGVTVTPDASPGQRPDTHIAPSDDRAFYASTDHRRPPPPRRPSSPRRLYHRPPSRLPHRARNLRRRIT